MLKVDMVLTVAQANRVAAAGGRRRRMLHARAAALWPTVIPYTFNENDCEYFCTEMFLFEFLFDIVFSC